MMHLPGRGDRALSLLMLLSILAFYAVRCYLTQAEREAMKKQRLPKGWTEAKIRKLAARHDHQSEEEQAAEIEAAISAKNQTVIVVPTKLVPEIQALIASRRGA
jgi:hypothetical protein